MSGPKKPEVSPLKSFDPYIFYITMPSNDLQKTKNFYSQVFGWEMSSENGHILNSNPSVGFATQGRSKVHPVISWAIPDLNAAVDKVKSLGGTVDDTFECPYCWMATCQDNQGNRFGLAQPTKDYDMERQPVQYPTKIGHAWFSAQPSKDIKQSMDFYAQVLGFKYSEVKKEKGYDFVEVKNIQKGDAQITCELKQDYSHLWFIVKNLDDTIGLVKKLGGSIIGQRESTEEGVHIDCEDDQGAVFSISQPAYGILPEPL